MLAEATSFGDREFYKDWWNCKDLKNYWQLWNLPVHHWFIKHLLNPLLKSGLSQMSLGFVIFFVSALMHEYIIAFAVFKPTWFAFAGMYANAFIIAVEPPFLKKFKLDQSNLGNIGFWFNFCIIGQPMIVVLYYITMN